MREGFGTGDPSPTRRREVGRIRRGVVRGWEVFTLLRSDPSSVSCADTFPHGEGFGALPRQCNNGMLHLKTRGGLFLYPLSQKSKIFASSPIGRAKGRCRASARVWWCDA